MEGSKKKAGMYTRVRKNSYTPPDSCMPPPRMCEQYQICGQPYLAHVCLPMCLAWCDAISVVWPALACTCPAQCACLADVIDMSLTNDTDHTWQKPLPEVQDAPLLVDGRKRGWHGQMVWLTVHERLRTQAGNTAVLSDLYLEDMCL